MTNKYTTLLYKVYHWLASLPPKIKWGNAQDFTPDEQERLSRMLASGYYVILTGSRHHLSSVMVSFLSWIKTGKWAKYSHVLMNCDNITDWRDQRSFKFVEATSTGVHYSTFEEVFGRDCDYACLLTPKNVRNEQWTDIIDELLNQRGLPYDDLFDLSDSTHVSCVELVWNALKNAGCESEFVDLGRLTKEEGNMVPQMYRDSTDFTIAFEE